MSLIACLLMFSATATEPVEPDPVFVPPLALDWCGPWRVPPCQQIISVTDGMPFALAGVEVGDRIVQFDRWHPLDFAEMTAVTRNCWTTLITTLTVQREQERLPIEVRGTLAYGKMGFDYRSGEASWLEAVLAKAGVEDAGDRAALRAMPWRVAALAWDEIDRGRVPAWWPALCADYLAAACGRPAPPLAPMPTPYLQRVDDLFRRVLGAHAAGLPPEECQDADEASFIALHYPYPVSPALPVGNLRLGSETERTALQALAEGRPSPEARNLAGQAANGAYGDVLPYQAYLNQVRAALLDRDGHGGWPYRSWLIYEKPARATVKEALEKARKDPLVDRQTCAIGLATLSAMDGDFARADAALREGIADSPWLQMQGWQFVLYAARSYNRERALDAHIAKHPLSCGPRPAVYEWLRRRKVAMTFPLHIDAVEAAVIRRKMGEFWPVWWSLGLPYGPMGGEGWTQAESMANICRHLAEDAAAGDGAEAVAAARQLMAVGRSRLQPAQVAAIAAAFARSGDARRAVSWQRAAIKRIPDNDRSEDERKRSRERLQLYQAGRSWLAPGSDAALTPVDQPLGTDRIRGGLRQGKAAGAWTRSDAQGRLREACRYVDGAPMGRWRAMDADGRCRWDGWVLGDARVGLWRIQRADGGTMEGWYDGQGGRCGWWRFCDAGKATIAEGFFLKGKPVGAWRRAGAEGRLEPSDPVTLFRTLAAGDDPPLPPTGGLGDVANPVNAF